MAIKPAPSTLRTWIRDARTTTLELIADLSDEQLRVAKLPIVNPLDWEVGHVAYFQELFALREIDGRDLIIEGADQLFDSIEIDHEVRWDLALPSRNKLVAYLNQIRDDLIATIPDPTANRAHWYRQLLSVFHEDMHDEALSYTRQTMGYSQPKLSLPLDTNKCDAGPLTGDVFIAGGRFRLGAEQNEERFVFDNEQWAHEVDVNPYAIARAPVTQAEFAAFVDDGGYQQRRLWSDEGWSWRKTVQAEHPMYWRRNPEGGSWQRRHFTNWVGLEPHHPVIHVCWHEAQAYCNWAGRRLPTELEWEVAAAAEPDANNRIVPGRKRHYPWGDLEPSPDTVNMDLRAMGCVDVAARPAGDSAFGCRQMLGNVWEWTADNFAPYPGFEPGPYKEYSAPLFGSTKVLRGGAWATRSRLIRNSWRNYYGPSRRDVWAGLRTCAP